METNDILLVKKLLEFSKRILDSMLNITEEQFMQSKDIQDMTLYRLGQIGEYSAKLSDEFKENSKNIDWFAIKGLRNRLFHDYDEINLNIVYKICTEMRDSLYNPLLNI